MPGRKRRASQMRIDELQEDRHEERDRHRRDLAPRVDAHPEPPEQVDEPRTGADLENQVEHGASGDQERRDDRGKDHQENGREASHHDQLALAGLGTHKPLPEVVRHVVGAHREMRRDRREERAHHRRRHHAKPPVRHEREHGRVREVALHEIGIHVGERLPEGREVGEHDERGEGRQVPGPRTDRVVHHLVEDRPAHAMSLALRGEHALHDVAATARLAARVPHVPPLDRNRDHEHGHEHIGRVQRGEERQMRLHGGMRHHR